MRKTITPKKKASPAKKAAAKNVEEYIARAPEPARAALVKLRSILRSVLPKETIETISYGIPAYKGKRVLVWFAGFAKHTSLFPTAAVIAMFKEELDGYTTSKGTIQFPLEKPLPVALIKRIVKARVAHDASRG